MSETTKYLIWSNEHRAWWKPGELGYTVLLSEAGRYSRDKAIELCADANTCLDHPEPNEVPVRDEDAAACIDTGSEWEE